MEKSKVVHEVGSREHESWLKRFKRLDGLLEDRYGMLVTEQLENPTDSDIERRLNVVGGEYVFSMRRTEHFERTGEVLPHPGPSGIRPISEYDYVTNERIKYADRALIDEEFHVALYTCLACLDRMFVRVDVTPITPHFGHVIPCPHCNGALYDEYVRKYGVPPTMPVRRRD